MSSPSSSRRAAKQQPDANSRDKDDDGDTQTKQPPSALRPVQSFSSILLTRSPAVVRAADGSDGATAAAAARWTPPSVPTVVVPGTQERVPTDTAALDGEGWDSAELGMAAAPTAAARAAATRTPTFSAGVANTHRARDNSHNNSSGGGGGPSPPTSVARTSSFASASGSALHGHRADSWSRKNGPNSATASAVFGSPSHADPTADGRGEKTWAADPAQKVHSPRHPTLNPSSTALLHGLPVTLPPATDEDDDSDADALPPSSHAPGELQAGQLPLRRAGTSAYHKGLNRSPSSRHTGETSNAAGSEVGSSPPQWRLDMGPPGRAKVNAPFAADASLTLTDPAALIEVTPKRLDGASRASPLLGARQPPMHVAIPSHASVDAAKGWGAASAAAICSPLTPLTECKNDLVRKSSFGARGLQKQQSLGNPLMDPVDDVHKHGSAANPLFYSSKAAAGDGTDSSGLFSLAAGGGVWGVAQWREDGSLKATPDSSGYLAQGDSQGLLRGTGGSAGVYHRDTYEAICCCFCCRRGSWYPRDPRTLYCLCMGLLLVMSFLAPVLCTVSLTPAYLRASVGLPDAVTRFIDWRNVHYYMDDLDQLTLLYTYFGEKLPLLMAASNDDLAAVEAAYARASSAPQTVYDESSAKFVLGYTVDRVSALLAELRAAVVEASTASSGEVTADTTSLDAVVSLVAQLKSTTLVSHMTKVAEQADLMSAWNSARWLRDDIGNLYYTAATTATVAQTPSLLQVARASCYSIPSCWSENGGREALEEVERLAGSISAAALSTADEVLQMVENPRGGARTLDELVTRSLQSTRARVALLKQCSTWLTSLTALLSPYRKTQADSADSSEDSSTTTSDSSIGSSGSSSSSHTSLSHSSASWPFDRSSRESSGSSSSSSHDGTRKLRDLLARGVDLDAGSAGSEESSSTMATKARLFYFAVPDRWADELLASLTATVQMALNVHDLYEQNSPLSGRLLSGASDILQLDPASREVLCSASLYDSVFAAEIGQHLTLNLSDAVATEYAEAYAQNALRAAINSTVSLVTEEESGALSDLVDSVSHTSSADRSSADRLARAGLLTGVLAPLLPFGLLAGCLRYRISSSPLPYGKLLLILLLCYGLVAGAAAVVYSEAKHAARMNPEFSAELLSSVVEALDALQTASSRLSDGLRLALLVAGSVTEAETELAGNAAAYAALYANFYDQQVTSTGTAATGEWLPSTKAFFELLGGLLQGGFDPLRQQLTSTTAMSLTTAALSSTFHSPSASSASAALQKAATAGLADVVLPETEKGCWAVMASAAANSAGATFMSTVAIEESLYSSSVTLDTTGRDTSYVRAALEGACFSARLSALADDGDSDCFVKEVCASPSSYGLIRSVSSGVTMTILFDADEDDGVGALLQYWREAAVETIPSEARNLLRVLSTAAGADTQAVARRRRFIVWTGIFVCLTLQLIALATYAALFGDSPSALVG